MSDPKPSDAILACFVGVVMLLGPDHGPTLVGVSQRWTEAKS